MHLWLIIFRPMWYLFSGSTIYIWAMSIENYRTNKCYRTGAWESGQKSMRLSFLPLTLADNNNILALKRPKIFLPDIFGFIENYNGACGAKQKLKKNFFCSFSTKFCHFFLIFREKNAKVSTEGLADTTKVPSLTLLTHVWYDSSALLVFPWIKK